MGKADSKLANTASFDNIKSVKKSIGVHKKNIPINSSSKSPQVEAKIAVSNDKSPRFVETTILVWLDASSEKTNDSTQKTFNHFCRVVNIVETFSDLEKCYHFMNSIKNEKILFVVSGTFGPQILPRIENFNQIYSIYIFCGNKNNHIEWTKPYKKIQGIHTQIKDLSEALRYDNNEYDKSLTSISVLPPTPIVELNQSNKEFVYLQVMKSIILEVQYDKKFRRELISYARQFYLNNEQQLSIIDTFEQNYHLHSPIWWYTRKCFIYRMLKKAFYEGDFEIIYKLAFFIRDLHREIKKCYLQAHNHQYHSISVYRAATMTNQEFENVESNQKGLLSFNDFVITTLEPSIALKFATKLRHDPNTIPIVYKIDIDPSKSSIPFIALNNLTYLSGTNGEVLLSMNTIFHIEQIEQISDRLFQITLTPASKKDEKITNLVDYMQEITNGLSGWYKLSKILMDAKEYNQVENIYIHIYGQINEKHREERAFLLHELGYIYELKNDLLRSISHYQQAIEIYLHYLPPDHPTLFSAYTNLGSVLRKNGDLNGALIQYQNAVKIDDSDNPNIILQYNNIGAILQQQGKYVEAQQTYEKTIKILLTDFQSAYSALDETYHNIAGFFYSAKNYPKALNYYQKALAIEEKSFPSDHSSFVSTYFNIATTYEGLKDYAKAIKYAEQSVDKARLVFGNEHVETEENLNYFEQLQQKLQTIT
jgi:tetratricopeptide (TPR) repeat protein